MSLDGHRTICAVLEELRTLVTEDRVFRQQEYIDLIDEAKDYAQRMSAKLVEYKRIKEGRQGE